VGRKKEGRDKGGERGREGGRREGKFLSLFFLASRRERSLRISFGALGFRDPFVNLLGCSGA
jgi:hypothetical protein